MYSNQDERKNHAENQHFPYIFLLGAFHVFFVPVCYKGKLFFLKKNKKRKLWSTYLIIFLFVFNNECFWTYQIYGVFLYNPSSVQYPLFTTSLLYNPPIHNTHFVNLGGKTGFFFLQCGVIKIVFFVAVGPVLKWLLPFQSGLLLSFAANSHSILCILRHILANKISVIKTPGLLV